jgi:hypothetical protein
MVAPSSFYVIDLVICRACAEAIEVGQICSWRGNGGGVLASLDVPCLGSHGS